MVYSTQYILYIITSKSGPLERTEWLTRGFSGYTIFWHTYMKLRNAKFSLNFSSSNMSIIFFRLKWRQVSLVFPLVLPKKRWTFSNTKLVVSTPLKNMSSSVGMMKFPIYRKKTCSKPPTRKSVILDSPAGPGFFWPSFFKGLEGSTLLATLTESESSGVRRLMYPLVN